MNKPITQASIRLNEYQLSHIAQALRKHISKKLSAGTDVDFEALDEALHAIRDTHAMLRRCREACGQPIRTEAEGRFLRAIDEYVSGEP